VDALIGASFGLASDKQPARREYAGDDDAGNG
jgi:hypothetical protein